MGGQRTARQQHENGVQNDATLTQRGTQHNGNMQHDTTTARNTT
jgi:hypothetical protein